LSNGLSDHFRKSPSSSSTFFSSSDELKSSASLLINRGIPIAKIVIRLLQTYHDERHYAAEVTTKYASDLLFSVIEKGVSTLNSMDHLAVTVGYKYNSTAIVKENFDTPHRIDPLELNGRPGTRAPHMWLKYQDKCISTLDLIGENFVLFTGEDNSLWRTATRNISSHLGLPINVYSIGSQGDCVESEDSWEALYDVTVTSQRAVLIRPDGFVA